MLRALQTSFQQGGIKGIALLGPGGSTLDQRVQGVQVSIGLRVYLYEGDHETADRKGYLQVEGIVAGWNNEHRCWFAAYDWNALKWVPDLEEVIAEMRREQLRIQIEEAFANTPSPGDEFDDISTTKQDEDIVAYFSGTTWRGHRVQDLRHHEAALSFFTDKAFRYWLPAFMLAELDDSKTADVIAGSIAFHLTYVPEGDTKLRQFSRDELEAIAAFLDECDRRYYSADFRDAASAVRAHLK